MLQSMRPPESNQETSGLEPLSHTFAGPSRVDSTVAVCSVLPPELPFCATPIGVVSQPPCVSPMLTRLVCPGLHILHRRWDGSLALAPRRAWPYHRPSCVEAKQAAHESSFSRFLHRLRGLCRGWDSNPRKAPSRRRRSPNRTVTAPPSSGRRSTY